MPGLAEMHVHLVGGWDGYAVDMLGYRRYLNALLYASVATVLDTGNVQPFIVQMRAEIAAGRLLGPDLYLSDRSSMVQILFGRRSHTPSRASRKFRASSFA